MPVEGSFIWVGKFGSVGRQALRGRTDCLTLSWMAADIRDLTGLDQDVCEAWLRVRGGDFLVTIFSDARMTAIRMLQEQGLMTVIHSPGSTFGELRTVARNEIPRSVMEELGFHE